MPLLLDTDYAHLTESGIDYVEDESLRFLVLRKFLLPEGHYYEKTCDVLVMIPPNYNQGGIDMFWTFPHLSKIDGTAIPAMNQPGGGDNRFFESKEFCRWSRHWNKPPVMWQPGKDDVETIIRRIVWAFGNPDAQK